MAGAEFHKFSLSGGGENCVEVATNLPSLVAIRDSKDPSGPALTFSTSGWDTFADGVKFRMFDF
ncbi:DUF397 domain-containing protein [Streptosporangium saharense]|uniref:DUF397 domain-containing protein n=1 Tax=Streptosporangium saharense TaxID=1706840 RepID=UPI0016209ABA|nr:DUF397 domain-containing protein [Streptosporangium saharense]